MRLERGTQFWEVTQAGSVVRMRWGTIGGAEKALDRELGSATAAAAKVAELADARRREGYVEVASRPSAEKPSGAGEARWAGRLEQGDMSIEVSLVGAKVRLRRDDGDDHVDDSTIEHDGADAAREVVTRIVRRALDDGYRLTHEGEELPPPPPRAATQLHRDTALEDACRAAPDDAGPWIVYADWLSARGDIRGEIAALSRGGKPRTAERVVRAYTSELYGEADRASITLEWRHGFPVAASLHAPQLAAFLASPLAIFVERLELVDSGGWGPALRAIGASAIAAHVRELSLGDFGALVANQVGDLADTWAPLTGLEMLTLRASRSGRLGAIALPALRRFVYESCAISESECAEIAAARWPQLEHLELWTGAAERGAVSTIAPLAPILEGRGLPALASLAVCNSELVDDLIPALAASPLLPRLRRVDLSKGTMAGEAAAALVAGAAAFAHLDELDLQQNMLSDDEVARIREVLPNVHARYQRDRSEDVDDDEPDGYRYIAINE